MSRLKRREPFGKAGLTVAVIALVLALVGGAYAAGGLTKSQEKQVTKIAKKYAGKPGATGAAGTAGANGTNGKDGAAGVPGTDGVSPTGTEFSGAKEGHCTKGGVEFKGATTTFACNGKEGSPWTLGGSLPEGATEKGEWNITQFISKGFSEGGFEVAGAAISFTVPLASAPEEGKVHFIGLEEGEGEPSEAEAVEEGECTGTSIEPGAAEGNVCVFASTVEAASPVLTPTTGLSGPADPFGVQLRFLPENKGLFLAKGSWAVTG